MSKRVPLLLVIVLVLNSCTKKSNETQQPDITPLVPSDGVIIRGGLGSKQSVEVLSNIDWNISIDPSASWLNATKTNVGGVQQAIFEVVRSNNSLLDRETVVTLKSVNNSSVPDRSIKVLNRFYHFSKLFGGTQAETGYSIAASPDGGSIVAGSTSSKDYDFLSKFITDLAIIKVDATGKKVWSKTYGGSSGDWATGIIALKDGGYLIVGETSSNDGDNQGGNGKNQSTTWVIKIDESGNVIWKKNYGTSRTDIESYGERGFSAAETDDGGFVIVSSRQFNEATGEYKMRHGDIAVMKIDAGGNKVWDRTYGGTNGDQPGQIFSFQDGSVWITGWTTSKDGDFASSWDDINTFVIKLDKNGQKVWAKVFGGSKLDLLNTSTPTKDGGLILGGRTESNDGDFNSSATTRAAWLMKIDANGNKVWTKTFERGGPDDHPQITSLAAHLTGYVLSYSKPGDNGAWIAKIDEIGNIIRENFIKGSVGVTPYALTYSKSGTYAITGQSNSNGGDISGRHGDFQDSDLWAASFSVQ